MSSQGALCVSPAAPGMGRSHAPFSSSTAAAATHLAAEAPAYEVKHTFIHNRIPRSPSLEACVRLRTVRSCPTLAGVDAGPARSAMQSERDGPVWQPAMCQQQDESSRSTRTHSPMSSGSTATATGGHGGSRGDVSTVAYSAYPCELPVDTPLQLTPGDMPAGWIVFVAAATWPDGAPSIGSRLHHLQKCRPCAFVHTKGCDDGLNCEFCHFCEPGERRRRRKGKREVMNNRRAMQRAKRDAEEVEAAMAAGECTLMKSVAHA